VELILKSEEPATSASLEALYLGHYREMAALAGFLVHDTAAGEDLAQESFVRFALRAPRLSHPDQLPYLRRILVNLTRSHHRRQLVTARLPWLERGTTSDVTSVAGIARADQRRVLDAIQALPRRQRECVVLRYYAELSFAEIAASLGVSASTAKTSLHRAQRALAIALEGERGA
jgi:RNA polymerase sigma factor (sigma-70 family)